MFTLDQIKQAHGKVKSGADFPSYIQELKTLGVTYYETFVADGHTDFSGEDHFKITAPAKFPEQKISDLSNVNPFKNDLKAHQQGNSDYATFIAQCAQAGILKWAVCLEKFTCTYYDKKGQSVLIEEIPQP